MARKYEGCALCDPEVEYIILDDLYVYQNHGALSLNNGCCENFIKIAFCPLCGKRVSDSIFKGVIKMEEE